ncbi:PEP-CTERM sorting domain-containing protein [Phragmitibacter flavus]|uniref:PEP-CTERM sorting domain-containing protein n=1 Tax=Phragmitibacter flavus TaxID=2576071 RepID=A0A5R8K8J1_9BACT|nr:autotransporter-associated beta strand repeat-containing protein [Phragmitibacter flavus]TLD68626.1 PEP-CTERM sorting domain-containing protein [Phragmitibacter flavus]
MKNPASSIKHTRCLWRKTLLTLGFTAASSLSTITAADFTWQGNQDALWNNGNNWDPAVFPDNTDTAIFNNDGNSFTILDLGGGASILNITYDTTAAAYTIGAGAVGSQTLTLSNTGAITNNAAVTNSQLINANVALGGASATIANHSAASLLTIAGAVSGAGGFTKDGVGALTLSGLNTNTGDTTLNAGTLNLDHAAALGNTTAGALIINGGTINNTSGAAITTTTAKAQTWAGDVTFIGSNNLNFNGGVVTLTGAGSRTVTVSAGTLGVGRITSASTGLNVAGPGVLAVTTSAASTIGGTLDVATGSTLRFNTGATGPLTNDFIATGLTGGGIIENGGGVERWLFINNAVDNTFTGILQNGAAGGMGLNKGGVGTLTLTGANTHSGVTTVRLGNLNLSATGSITASSSTGSIVVNAATGTTATMTVDGGSILVGANNAGNASIIVGNVNGGAGIFNVGAGSDVTTGGVTGPAREIHVGRGGFGTANITGGTVTVGGFIVGGIATNGVGIWNVSGGSVSVGTNGNWGATFGASGGTTGVLNLTGGTFNNTHTGTSAGLWVGENGRAEFNISGTGQANLGGNTSNGNSGLVIGKNNGAAGIVNLGAVGAGGGTISTTMVSHTGNGTGRLNFHGGTLQARTGAAANFMSGLTSAHVYAEGGTIDNNGQAITIAQALLAPTGFGINALDTTGLATTGYTTAPLVTITGGTGTAATANATVDASGNLTGFIITNPGSDYTAGDTLTVTLSGGGKNTTSASTTSATLSENAGGGMTYIGTGTTTLTAANTYTGGTIITQGRLLANNTTGSATGTGSVSVTSGATLGGTGSISGGRTANITLGAGSFLAVGNTHGAGGLAETLELGTGGTITSTADTTFQFDLMGAGTAGAAPAAYNFNNDYLDFTTAAAIDILGVIQLSAADTSSWLPEEQIWKLIDWTGITDLGASMDLVYSGIIDNYVLSSFTDDSGFYIRASLVPEPSRVLLMMAGLCLLGLRRKR